MRTDNFKTLLASLGSLRPTQLEALIEQATRLHAGNESLRTIERTGAAVEAPTSSRTGTLEACSATPARTAVGPSPAPAVRPSPACATRSGSWSKAAIWRQA